MRKNAKIYRLAFPVATLLLFACGDNVTEINKSTELESYNTFGEMPRCNDRTTGRMAFVQDEGEVYYCVGQEWVTLDGLDGKDGKAGSSGSSCDAYPTKGGDGYSIVCGGDTMGVVLNGADGTNGLDGRDGNIGKNGQNGLDGTDGANCTMAALADNSGYKVLCGGDSVGVLLNGTDGTDGKNGKTGKNGEDSGDCMAYPLETGDGYKFVCDGDSVGVVYNGTDGKNGKDGVSITPGESNYCVSEPLEDNSGYTIICNGEPIGEVYKGSDGSKGTDGDNSQACEIQDNGDGTVDVTCGGVKQVLYTMNYGNKYNTKCGDKYYDSETEYCWNQTIKAKLLCGNKYYAPETEYCWNQTIKAKLLCGDKYYNSETEYCWNQTIKAKLLCGGKYYDLEGVCTDGKLSAVTDKRDGKTYKMVYIGTQVWMAENLNYSDSVNTTSLKSRSWCYSNTASNCTKYGRLYTWAAAIDSVELSKRGLTCGDGKTCTLPTKVKGICPDGFHLPTNAEWDVLYNYVYKDQGLSSSKVGTYLKSSTGWNSYSGIPTGKDTYGFSALPAGYRYTKGSFYYAGSNAYFWSATEYNRFSAYYRALGHGGEDFVSNNNNKYFASSIRCLKD